MYRIININKQNLADYPQVICFINPKNQYFNLKMEWLAERFAEGLSIRLLQLNDTRKIAGFIEYIPGEFAWRAVSTKDYLFIHCIWVYPNQNKQKGFGSALIEEAVNDAKRMNMKGVAVVTSDSSFMAEKDLFLKNGFKVVDEIKNLQLLALQFDKDKPSLSLNNSAETLAGIMGWQIIYTRQCPWVARFIEEIKPIIREKGLDVEFKELTTAREAQQAPSVYATFNFVKDGRLLADRYISVTRFKNILAKTSPLP
ncbi:MAG: GNAT family N-acetyltransferase [Bacteroidales bacterium]|nr:GNAT family N-acetyltransferase [Bacteroidales bacterium]